MRALGILNKMRTTYVNPVRYTIKLGEEQVELNELMGKRVQLLFTGNIYCTICGRKTKKSFAEGLCYQCFIEAPENAECIIRPELCEAHLGKGRDPEWEQAHHHKPHYVYLALTNSVKVGVTRDTQIPTRWIDQGANKGIILARTEYRQAAGLIEVALKDHLSDKTNWQRMLKNEVNNEINLLEEKKRVHELIPEPYRQYIHPEDEIVEITYPVISYPTKVTSFSFDKVTSIDLPLTGIRGQYLIFEGGNVINIRKHSGYEVEMIY